jgi:hypothetical protein
VLTMPRIELQVPLNCRITIKEVKRTEVVPFGQFVEVANDTEKPIEWITRLKPIQVEPWTMLRLEVGTGNL